MKDKLLCALSNNVKDIVNTRGNFWLKTKQGWIGLCKSQKYVIETIEIKKALGLQELLLENN